VGIAANARAAYSYFVLIRATVHHQRLLFGAPMQNSQQGRQPSALGNQSREPGLLPQPRTRRQDPLLAVGQSLPLAQDPKSPPVRYKMSQRPQVIVLLPKRSISSGHRHKMSYRRKLLF